MFNFTSANQGLLTSERISQQMPQQYISIDHHSQGPLSRDASITWVSTFPRRAGTRAGGSKCAAQTARRRKSARIRLLSRRLLGQDPISTFANNCATSLPGWFQLLQNTTPPPDVRSSDPRILSAFQRIDEIICGQGQPPLRRLAHVQLIRLFDWLEATIKFERDNGHIASERYQRNTNAAMTIYVAAQGAPSNELRIKLRQGRKRFSKRWADLATKTPLLVLVYSDAAEVMV